VELCLHSSNMPSWRGAQLKKHRDNFTLEWMYAYRRASTYTGQQNTRKTWKYIHASSRIRTKGLSVRAAQHYMYLKPCGNGGRDVLLFVTERPVKRLIIFFKKIRRRIFVTTSEFRHFIISFRTRCQDSAERHSLCPCNLQS